MSRPAACVRRVNRLVSVSSIGSVFCQQLWRCRSTVTTWHHDTAGTVARKRDRRLLVKRFSPSMSAGICARIHATDVVLSLLVRPYLAMFIITLESLRCSSNRIGLRLSGCRKCQVAVNFRMFHRTLRERPLRHISVSLWVHTVRCAASSKRHRGDMQGQGHYAGYAEAEDRRP